MAAIWDHVKIPAWALRAQKPLSQENILYHYLPLLGAVDYHLLALNVLNPELPRSLLRSVGLKLDLSHGLICGSILGASLHLYSRRHMSGLSLAHRAYYSAYFGSISILGSVLLWAIGSRTLPSHPLFRTALALTSAFGMLRLKLSFLRHLDIRCGHN